MRVPILVLAVVLQSSTGLAYDDRHVFITNRAGANIVELDDEFAFVRTWFGGEVFDGQPLSAPNGMGFTPSGELFVADSGNSRIVAFDGEGGFARVIATDPRMSNAVESIYFSSEGVLFASANPGIGVVARYTQTGDDLPDVVSGAEFVRLSNINLTEAGDVVVADFSGFRGVREIDPETGAVLRTFGADLELHEDVMIDGADRVFVTHHTGAEIVVYGPAPEREELYRFRPPESEPTSFARPTGIALTYDCHILVSGFESGAIFIFRHEGGSTPPTYLRALRPGEEIPESAQLGSTESIAVAGLQLPGGFSEFVDRVPTCDPPPPPPDLGPRLDGGPRDAGAAVVDAFAGVDAGPVEGDEGGCGCRVASPTRSPSVWWLVGAAGLLARRRRRARS